MGRWVVVLGLEGLHVCLLGPQLEVSGQLGSLHLLLTPRQLQQLQKLLSAINLAGKAMGTGWQVGWLCGITTQAVLKHLLYRSRRPD